MRESQDVELLTGQIRELQQIIIAEQEEYQKLKAKYDVSKYDSSRVRASTRPDDGVKQQLDDAQR